MIREASEDDIPVVLEMSRKVHEGSVYSIVPFVAEDMTASLLAMLKDEDHTLLVTGDPPEAVFALRFGRLQANRSISFAMELFWYVETKGLGGRFLKAAEEWVKEKGYPLMNVSLAVGLDPRVMMLYERREYVPSEFHFMKVL